MSFFVSITSVLILYYLELELAKQPTHRVKTPISAAEKFPIT